MTILMTILGFFRTVSMKVWAYLGIAMSVLWLIARIYAAGGKAKEVKDLHNTLDSVRTRKDVEQEVDELNYDAVIERLRRNGWYKDNK